MKKNIVIAVLLVACGALSSQVVSYHMDSSYAAKRLLKNANSPAESSITTDTLNEELKSLSRDLSTSKDIFNSHEKIDILRGSEIAWKRSDNGDGTSVWTGKVQSWKLEADGLEEVDKVDVTYTAESKEMGLTDDCIDENSYKIDSSTGTLEFKLKNVPNEVSAIGVKDIMIYRLVTD